MTEKSVAKHTSKRATAIGAIAILVWSTQALLTTATGNIPPFQLTAMAFAIGGLAGFTILAIKGRPFAAWKQPWPVWLLGVGALFSYHALYFMGLRNAPPAEASLVAYLWPLLIVLFAALLPGARLRTAHVIGALMGLAGAGMIVSGGQAMNIDPAFAFGYICAAASAIIWGAYSVVSRRLANVPSQIVTAFCLATAILAFISHLVFETTVWPEDFWQMLAVVGLGLGPLGLAFTVWDIGMKHGNISLLGVASYAAPLLSTLLLVIFGVAQATLALALAALLITMGAIIASRSR